MNPLIKQIEKMPGVKKITPISEQFPNAENTALVTFEPVLSYRELIEKAASEGKIIEYTPLGSDNWKFCKCDSESPMFNWNDYDFRIADLDNGWLGTIANMNKSLANRIVEWFDGTITDVEY